MQGIPASGPEEKGYTVSYAVAVYQDHLGPSEWSFMATFIEKDDQGVIISDQSAEIQLHQMSATIDVPFFLEGAKQALAKLEADQS